MRTRVKTLRKALELLQEAQAILDGAALAVPDGGIEQMSIEIAHEDPEKAIESVGGLASLPTEEAMGEAK